MCAGRITCLLFPESLSFVAKARMLYNKDAKLAPSPTQIAGELAIEHSVSVPVGSRQVGK